MERKGKKIFTPSLGERIVTHFEHHFRKWSLIGAVIGIAIALFLWKSRSDKQDELAGQNAIWTSEMHIQAGRYDLALNGDEGEVGLLAALERYGHTKAGGPVHIHLAHIYLMKGDKEAAILHLKAFHQPSTLLQGRVWALLGDIYCDLERYEEAHTYYEKAIKHQPGRFTTPHYLCKAARLYEKQGAYRKAIACYEKVCRHYYKCRMYTVALKHMSRLKTKLKLASTMGESI